MIKRRWKYVATETTRHGSVVYYFRRGIGPRIRLPDDPKSKDFIEAYNCAKERGEKMHVQRPKKEKENSKKSKKYLIEQSLRKGLNAAKNRAREKNRSFDLDLDWAISEIEKNNFRCELTQIPFFETPANKTSRHPFAPSFDRLDNSKGYTKDNVRIVALAVNVMLSDWGEDVFGMVVNYFRKNKKRTSMAEPKPNHPAPK